MSQPAITTRHELSPGDIGRVSAFHGIVYADEMAWDLTFEAYVARGLAEIALRFDSERDRIWLAERAGELVGCIGIVSSADGSAQLRWFLVHPDCRGKGLGHTLLHTALDFCRSSGRRRVFLWTVRELAAAARLYREVGFRLTKSQVREQWGTIVTEERYDLDLGSG